MKQEAMCACGKPLHYSNPETQRQVQSLVDELGATIRVRGSNGRVWLVPRHYLALHGLKARELPELGFPEVTAEPDKSFSCPKCGMASFNPHDVEAKYCGNCHEFHEQEG